MDKRRKKKYFGYFATLKPNAGNVLYNNAMFNSMMNDHGEGGGADNGASEGTAMAEDYNDFNNNVILKISSQDMEQGVLNGEDITPYTLGMYYNLYFSNDKDNYWIEGTAEDMDQFIKDFHIRDLKSARFISM